MKRLARNISYIIILCLLLICLSGCQAQSRIVIYNSQDTKIINIDNSFLLNQGHSYDIEYTEDGMDITIHFDKHTKRR